MFSDWLVPAKGDVAEGGGFGGGLLLRLSFTAGGRKRIKATEKEQGRDRLAS